MKKERKDMVDKMIKKFGFENIKTLKFADTASKEAFSDEHVEIVFQALYGE